MKLVAKPVRLKTTGSGKIARLLKSAFPREEQIPFWILRLMALRRNVHFTAFYEDDNFVGTVYAIENRKYYFILYLAVNMEMRSNGFGGKILDYAYKEAGKRNIVLNVEAVEAQAYNYETRKRRLAFYEKHGICDTGYRFSDAGVSYATLASDVEKFDAWEYEKFLSSLVPGASHV